MTNKRYHLLLLLLTFICTETLAQIKDIGLPFIINHQRDVYNASNQNWAVAQSERGFMYFGNNDGILEFDGTSWRTYPVPNASIVRSLYTSGDTIYAGAFEHMGFLAPDTNGTMTWHSLLHLIPHEFRNFDEIWKIFKLGNKVIFQSFNYIFVLKDNAINVVKDFESLGFLHKVNEELFIVEKEQGLSKFKENQLIQVSDHPLFFRTEVTAMLPYGSSGIIIGTANEGLFLWDGSDLQPWNSQVNDFLKQHNLFCAITLEGGNYAFGSVSDGIYITDEAGNILQHINRIKGLQNNTVLAMLQDRRNNLWLGLDNGIDYLEISSPISLLNHNFSIESAYASILHHDILYVGTNQGLFAAPVTQLSNRNVKNPFRLIRGTEGQVWNLQEKGGQLLCGHNYGLFEIEGYTARQISDIRGFWSFEYLPESRDTLLAGTYTGFVRLVNRNGRWQYLDEMTGFRESSRSFYIDHKNEIWVSHGYRGIFRIAASNDFSTAENVKLYFNRAGLPDTLPYNIQRIDRQPLITTHEGIMRFDHEKQKFIPDENLNQLFNGIDFIDYIHQDAGGSLWYFSSDHMGLLRILEDGTFRNIQAPFSRINKLLIPAFHNISIANNHSIFIGTQNGLAHYNPTIINDYSISEQVFFKEISFYFPKMLLTFNLYSNEVANNEKHKPSIPWSGNSVSFRFTSPVFENPQSLRFSYKLEGFDETWSDWNNLNFKEYTNLREGEYTFRVKALNAFGVESKESIFSFTIKPPLLRSREAYIGYIIFFFLIIIGNIYFVRRRILKIRKREKIRHERRMAQREKIFQEQSALSEKEIMQLRNEGLHNEMRHKNQELANATLHLIQKNKTLTNLKNDLNKLLKNIPSDNPEKHNVNNLLKKVNRDLRNEKNWELFNSYFDDVHQDFINRLKEKHADLSPKELRLCAYLRMNLSTKEIAPLMNISIRGVEISRYRLRKKLQLEHDKNLTDYLMTY